MWIWKAMHVDQNGILLNLPMSHHRHINRKCANLCIYESTENCYYFRSLWLLCNQSVCSSHFPQPTHNLWALGNNESMRRRQIQWFHLLFESQSMTPRDNRSSIHNNDRQISSNLRCNLLSKCLTTRQHGLWPIESRRNCVQSVIHHLPVSFFAKVKIDVSTVQCHSFII